MVSKMNRLCRNAPLAAALMLAIAVPAAAASATSVFQSRHLWSTVDVCNTAKHPDVVGVRGSMPGTGSRSEQMFMRFRLEYQTSGGWVYDTGADSGFVAVGSAEFKARQSGFDFTVTPGTGGYVVRGVVTFEWRQGAKVLVHAQKATTAGHLSIAGADPPGYSAAACSIP
jgi:hypothetical protein